jgi:hypothetical protein
MNQFLQNNLFTLILFLLFIILLLVGVLTFIVFKLLAQKNQNHDLITPILPITPSPPTVVEKYTCSKHKDLPTVGSCLICEDVFCESCLIEHEGMFFCKDHFKTYANHKWKQVTDFKTNANEPEAGIFIYDFKRKVWFKKGIPSFVLTHYKINVEEDLIESYIQLHVREEDEIEFTKGLSSLIK